MDTRFTSSPCKDPHLVQGDDGSGEERGSKTNPDPLFAIPAVFNLRFFSLFNIDKFLLKRTR